MRAVIMSLAVAVTTLAGVTLYHVKYEVSRMEAELARLNHRFLDAQREVRVLKAEWAYLNAPDRLQSLAERFLPLAPIAAEQIASFDALPWRPVEEGGVLAGRPTPGQPPLARMLSYGEGRP